ncbi:MAG: hypothetical protein WCE96_02620 [Nitrososphaeraceae archaeon]
MYPQQAANSNEKKTSADMKEMTGVEASMNEGEMKDYVELVIKELRSK